MVFPEPAWPASTTLRKWARSTVFVGMGGSSGFDDGRFDRAAGAPREPDPEGREAVGP